jgi:hypothetical protein
MIAAAPGNRAHVGAGRGGDRGIAPGPVDACGRFDACGEVRAMIAVPPQGRAQVGAGRWRSSHRLEVWRLPAVGSMRAERLAR